ncbi:MAG TPA: hypothetical protein VNM92_05340 [Thermoanaerobaculia bacterium]|nr:hypothetical protein [Thermoanaerobaculia bacterium]
MALDYLSRSFYSLQLSRVYQERRATEFQSFFERVMSLRYASDFVPVAPWGAKGDMKNDGYLKTERKLFAVYAPRELKLSPTKAKVTKDDDVPTVVEI